MVFDVRGVKPQEAALGTIKEARDMPSFTRQDRPEKVKEIYRALKRDHPEMPAAMKARIAARQGKPGKQKQGPPYKGPLTPKTASACLDVLWEEYGPGLQKHAALDYLYRATKVERDAEALTPEFCKLSSAFGVDPWELADSVAKNLDKFAAHAKVSSNPDVVRLAQYYMDWAGDLEKRAGFALVRRAAGGVVQGAKSVGRRFRRPAGTSPTPRPAPAAPTTAPVRPAGPTGSVTSSRSGAVNIGETSVPVASGRSGAVNLGTVPAGAAPAQVATRAPTPAAPTPGPYSAQAASTPVAPAAATAPAAAPAATAAPATSAARRSRRVGRGEGARAKRAPAGQAKAPAGTPASAPASAQAETAAKGPATAPASTQAGAPASGEAAATAPKHSWGDVALGGGIVGVPAAAYLMGGSGQPQPY